ncbi:PhaM family polyhydroxyalkanoate granule multifunctional regulatory protein [Undibacterium sp.]|uniref:PhaM family polyhydroxyalkanoate granule multifunctional regulatory protein n=1 Tax=Undibacterium sp. TaxID=1914977 RepID=UPI002BC2B217|nr:PhaM family polyhydroxyalkanoate granule multifunctional regulatory protein [Undibacterium sp.]HTD06073.1 PhaM family polyhydroxyalkanoate granule multifunctional regulatory protein [Undibacterium sp.]
MTSQFPGGEMPGMTAMNDTLAFVKKLWGGMQVPGMVAPTVSMDDLDKKIKDLKTVESWLNVNMNMLRGTIQALEVQRATIATLNSMGASFSNAMSNPDTSPFARADVQEKAGPKATHTGWPMPPAQNDQAAAAPDANPETDQGADDELEEREAGPEDVKAEEGTASSQFVNPAAWWTLLQDQFKQAVNNAMAGELTPKEDKPASAARTAPARSSAKKTSKATTKATAKSGSTAAKKTASKSGSKTVASKSAIAKPKPVSIAIGKHTTPKA